VKYNLLFRIAAFLAVVLWLVLFVSYVTSAKQMTPDVKRQREIRAALIAHGYEPGKSWSEVVVLLKQIAREHCWQHSHAPDARVLILLGLGNKHSDPDVLNESPSTLEPGLLSCTRKGGGIDLKP